MLSILRQCAGLKLCVRFMTDSTVDPTIRPLSCSDRRAYYKILQLIRDVGTAVLLSCPKQLWILRFIRVHMGSSSLRSKKYCKMSTAICKGNAAVIMFRPRSSLKMCSDGWYWCWTRISQRSRYLRFCFDPWKKWWITPGTYPTQSSCDRWAKARIVSR